MATAATTATISSMMAACMAVEPRPRARQTPAKAAITMMNATNRRIAICWFVAGMSPCIWLLRGFCRQFDRGASSMWLGWSRKANTVR